MKAGGADDGVELRPSGGVGGRGDGDSGVVGDVAAGVAKRWIQSGEIGLVGAGEAPDVVTTGKEAYGEGAADAGAGAGEDKVQQRGVKGKGRVKGKGKVRVRVEVKRKVKGTTAGGAGC